MRERRIQYNNNECVRRCELQNLRGKYETHTAYNFYFFSVRLEDPNYGVQKGEKTILILLP